MPNPTGINQYSGSGGRGDEPRMTAMQAEHARAEAVRSSGRYGTNASSQAARNQADKDRAAKVASPKPGPSHTLPAPQAVHSTAADRARWAARSNERIAAAPRTIDREIFRSSR